MPELRRDPIVGRWVVFTGEGLRPVAPREPEEAAAAPAESCPFCEGNESRTPRELFAFREPGSSPDGPGWRVRVVPHKFPMLRVEGDVEHRAVGIYDAMNGVGAHEVIVESPRHVASPAELTPAAIGEGLAAARERIADLRRDARFVYPALFRSVGPAAGATTGHVLSQLIVSPVLPLGAERLVAGGLAYFGYRGRCVWCDVAREESRDGARLVAENDGAVAIAPFASRFPFETWIVPRRHEAHFETLDGGLARDVAELLSLVFRAYDVALEKPAYNTILHTAPFTLREAPHFHWHFEVLPRLLVPSGFEWGTGFHVNPVRPEDAAAALREATS